MLYALISLVLAFAIAFGRHFAVIGRLRSALWFFRNFETKRMWFTVGAFIFGVLGWMQIPPNPQVFWVLVSTGFLIGFAFLFDMKRFFPEINKVERIARKDVTIASSTAVIGVNIRGQAVAYPMDVVIPRHIINDQISGQAVLISFCAICQSALAFEASAAGRTFNFKVAGVWRRNMIVHDDVSYSLWQQASGECIYGPLKGAQLPLISGENTSWEAWLKKHPESEYAAKCVEARRGYFSRTMLKNLLAHLMPKAMMPGFTDLTGLDPHATVFGVNFNGISRAYPAKGMIGKETFSDIYNGQELTLSFDQSSDYLSAMDVSTGQEIIVEKHWWLGWKEFHAESEIWNG